MNIYFTKKMFVSLITLLTLMGAIDKAFGGNTPTGSQENSPKTHRQNSLSQKELTEEEFQAQLQEQIVPAFKKESPLILEPLRKEFKRSVGFGLIGMPNDVISLIARHLSFRDARALQNTCMDMQYALLKTASWVECKQQLALGIYLPFMGISYLYLPNLNVDYQKCKEAFMNALPEQCISFGVSQGALRFGSHASNGDSPLDVRGMAFSLTCRLPVRSHECLTSETLTFLSKDMRYSEVAFFLAYVNGLGHHRIKVLERAKKSKFLKPKGQEDYFPSVINALSIARNTIKDEVDPMSYLTPFLPDVINMEEAATLKQTMGQLSENTLSVVIENGLVRKGMSLDDISNILMLVDGFGDKKEAICMEAKKSLREDMTLDDILFLLIEVRDRLG
jgi:hypothetical protein